MKLSIRLSVCLLAWLLVACQTSTPDPLEATIAFLYTEQANLHTQLAPSATPNPSPTSTPTQTPTATPKPIPTRTATLPAPTATPSQALASAAGQFILQDSFPIGSEALSSVAFSPDGSYLAVGSADRFVYLLQTGKTTSIKEYRHSDRVSSLAFFQSSLGLVVAGGNAVNIWIYDSGDIYDVYQHNASVYGVAVSPDFKWIASASEDGEIKILDNNTGIDTVLQEPGEPVWSLAFSTDSKTLAAGGEKIRLYDLDSAPFDGAPSNGAPSNGAAVMLTLIPAGKVSSLAFSPSDPWLASGGEALELWDAILGERIFTLQGHTGWVWSVAFSPDGLTLASGSKDKTVRLWNPITGDLLQTLEGYTDSINSVAFSPDGKQLASVGQDMTVNIWQWLESQAVNKPTLEPMPTAVAGEPRGPLSNGKIVFISDRDGNEEIYVMNPDGSGVTRLTNTPDTIESWPTWSPDGMHIAYYAFSPQHQALNVMDADGSNPVMVADIVVNQTRPSWSPDGQWLVLSSGLDPSSNSLMQPQLYIVRPDGSQLSRLTNNRGMDQYPVWSPNNAWIAFQSDKSTLPTIYVIHPDGSGQKMIGPNTCYGARFTWSPDSQALAATCQDSTAPGPDMYLLTVEGGSITRLTNDALSDAHPSWSPDGRQIVFTHQVDNVYLADIFIMNADGSNRRRLTTALEPDADPQWSPDGKQILFISQRSDLGDIFVMNPDGSGQMNLTNSPGVDMEAHWQPVSGASVSLPTALPAPSAPAGQVVISPENAGQLVELNRLTEHDDPIVGALAFSPDSKLLATGDNGRNIRLWDPLTGELLAILEGHTDNINTLAFSPDGRWLASGGQDKQVSIWDGQTFALHASLPHTDVIYSLAAQYLELNGVAFSPDGRLLASASADTSIVVWDMQTREPVNSLGHASNANAVVFSPDGTLLATAGSDGTVKVWHILR